MCSCKNQKYIVKISVEFINKSTGSFSFSFESISNDSISNCSLPNNKVYNKAYNKALINFLHKHKNYTNITKITSSINTVTKIKNCEYDTNARIGYYKTLWPSEMTDLYRSHCVLNGGLHLLPKKLKITTFGKLPAPTFGYTRKQNEIYIIGGSQAILGFYINGILNETAVCQDDIVIDYIPYVSKFNYDLSSHIVTNIDYGKTVNYIGGLLIHENGFIYAVAKSVVYKLDPDTLQIINYKNLPLVDSDGEIVYKVDSISYLTIYNGIQVLKNGRLILKAFTQTKPGPVYGVMVQVDPDTLELLVTFLMTEGTSARLTIYTDASKNQYVSTINSTEIIRYLITDSTFILENNYTKQYRTPDSTTSTPGSSTIIFDKINRLSFSNNTDCNPLTGMQIYNYPVDTNGSIFSTNAFTTSSPGYNFFMIASDNIINQYVICYDPIIKSISCNKLYSNGKFEFIWQQNNLTISACIAIVVNKNHIYIDDYVNGYDYFVVLELLTGNEISRIKTKATLPTIGGIFPGMNNDVYLLSNQIGDKKGYITRIFT